MYCLLQIVRLAKLLPRRGVPRPVALISLGLWHISARTISYENARAILLRRV